MRSGKAGGGWGRFCEAGSNLIMIGEFGLVSLRLG